MTCVFELVQKHQHARELISARKTSHNHNNKGPRRPRYTSKFTWHTSKFKVRKLHQRQATRVLVVCDVFRTLINSLCVLILHERSGPRSGLDGAEEFLNVWFVLMETLSI